MFLDIVERKYDANTSNGKCVGRSGCSVRVCVELGFFPVTDGGVCRCAWRGMILEFKRSKYEKGIWWMPWRIEAMKDVVGCEKPWGAANKH